MEQKKKFDPRHTVEVSTVKPETTIFVDEQTLSVINFTDELSLDGKLSDLNVYLQTTNGLGKTEEQKDMDYIQAQTMWKEYQNELRNVRFNFHLDRAQYNLLTDILLKKLEYDVNTVFIAIDLTELLGAMSGAKYSTDKEIKSFQTTATEITYIYHLIQNYKVKGLTKEAYTFSKILRRIGEISKIVSYYDANAKNLTDEISKWALKLDDPFVAAEIPELTKSEA
jgi:hypothetical protein